MDGCSCSLRCTADDSGSLGRERRERFGLGAHTHSEAASTSYRAPSTAVQHRRCSQRLLSKPPSSRLGWTLLALPLLLLGQAGGQDTIQPADVGSSSGWSAQHALELQDCINEGNGFKLTNWNESVFKDTPAK